MAVDTWLLMQLYWKLDRREVTAQSKWRIVATVAAVIGMLFIGAFAAAFGYIMSLLTRPDLPVRLPPGIVPGVMLTVVLIGVLITGLNQAVKALFLSGDLDRLMVAPVHTRSVMVAKLLSRLPGHMLLILFIAAPAFVAYGIGIGAGPVYYVLVALMLLLAPLFGLAVGAVIAMLLVRWLPVNRLNELLTAAYALIGIGIALLAQLPRLFIRDDPETMVESVSGGAISSLTATLERLPVPTLWAGRGMVGLDSGQVDAIGLLGLALYGLMTIGLFLAVVMAADRLYLSGWLKTQSTGGKRRGLETDSRRFGRGSLPAAIAWKDWLQRIRDPRQLVSLVGSGFIAVVVGALAIFRGGAGGDESLMSMASQGDLPVAGPFAAVGAAFSPGVLMATWALFVAYVFLSNTATYALALEGLAFPMLKAAPIRPREVWSAKLWSIYWPFAVVFLGVLAASWLFARFSLLWVPYAVAVGLIMGYGLVAANISVGFRYANLSWTDPRRMLTSGGGLVSLLLWVLYALPTGLIALAGFALAAVRPGWSIPTALGAVVLLAVLTWAFHLWMVRWGESAWEKLPV